MIYGITGKIASGKNYVSSLIELKEHMVIDLDQMAKDSYAVLADEIKAEFGTTDRQELAKKVFADPKRRRALEAIIYPYLRSQIKKIAKENNIPVFINGALLRRSGLDKICECVIYVDASERLRYIRARRRSNITREEFESRDKAQKDVDYTKFEYHCPVEVIVNERNTHVRSELNAILKKYGLRTRRPRIFIPKEAVEIEEIQEPVVTPVIPETKTSTEEIPMKKEDIKKEVEKPVKEIKETKETKEVKTEKAPVAKPVKEVKVETSAPVLSNEDMYIFPESVTPEPSKKEKTAKPKKKHPGLVILIILAILGGGSFCFFRFISPSSLDYIQSKTSSPLELPKISDLVEKLSGKKELKPVELPPEVKAPAVVEKVKEAVEEKVVEKITEIAVDKAAEYGISEETVKEVIEAVPSMSLDEIAQTVEAIQSVETPEEILSVLPEEVVESVTEAAAEAVEVPSEEVVVQPVPASRTDLHKKAIEELPGDLKFILMTL